MKSFRHLLFFLALCQVYKDCACQLAHNANNMMTYGQRIEGLNTLVKMSETGVVSPSVSLSDLEETWEQLKLGVQDLQSYLLHKSASNVLFDNLEQANISTQCVESLTQFFLDLVIKHENYTIRVLDATGKLPPGVMNLNMNWVGSFKECTDISVFKNTSKVFVGEYCTVSLAKENQVQQAGNPMGSLQIGICVPDVCDAGSLQELANAVLNSSRFSSFGLEATVSCATEIKLTRGDYAAIILCSLLGFLVLVGTVYDVIVSTVKDNRIKASYQGGFNSQNESPAVDADDDEIITNDESDSKGLLNVLTKLAPEEPGIFGQLILAFSVLTNGKKILTARRQSGALSSLNGIRVLSMWWVILGHSFLFLMYMLDNLLDLFYVTQRFTFQAIINGTFSVDTFFFLSGLLVCYLTLKHLRDNGSVNWAVFYLHRFWRLTPLYMFVIMIYSTLFKFVAHGPYQNGAPAAQVSGNCDKYWWTNLLYINNLYPAHLGEECLAWGWYLANDMQFYIISPLIIYLIYRNVPAGLSLISGLILTCLTIRGVLATHYSMLATATPPQPTGNQTVANTMLFDLVYVKPYTRMAPYLVGMIIGWFIASTGGMIRIRKVVVVLGWCAAAAINLLVLYGLYQKDGVYVERGQAVDSFYIATNRFAWSLGLAWLTVACVTGYGGPVKAFLSWRVWEPLGRLTYGAYLVHPMVIEAYLLRSETLMHYTELNFIYFFIGNLVLSYVVAFVVSLLVEAPCLALEKVVLKRFNK